MPSPSRVELVVDQPVAVDVVRLEVVDGGAVVVLVVEVVAVDVAVAGVAPVVAVEVLLVGVGVQVAVVVVVDDPVVVAVHRRAGVAVAVAVAVGLVAGWGRCGSCRRASGTPSVVVVRRRRRRPVAVAVGVDLAAVLDRRAVVDSVADLVAVDVAGLGVARGRELGPRGRVARPLAAPPPASSIARRVSLARVAGEVGGDHAEAHRRPGGPAAARARLAPARAVDSVGQRDAARRRPATRRRSIFTGSDRPAISTNPEALIAPGSLEVA